MCVDFNETALPDASCSNVEQRPSETELCDVNVPYCNGDEDNNENSNMIWYDLFIVYDFLVHGPIYPYCRECGVQSSIYYLKKK